MLPPPQVEALPHSSMCNPSLFHMPTQGHIENHGNQQPLQQDTTNAVDVSGKQAHHWKARPRVPTNKQTNKQASQQYKSQQDLLSLTFYQVPLHTTVTSSEIMLVVCNYNYNTKMVKKSEVPCTQHGKGPTPKPQALPSSDHATSILIYGYISPKP